MPQTWRVIDDPASETLRAISEGVIQHGRAVAAKVGGDARPLACLVEDEGVLVAGLAGRTEFGRLFVNYLWVAPSLRGQGLGTKMLVRAENEAERRGCTDALIETLEERTARLYERLGYTPMAVLPYVGPFRRHTMIKPLRRADLPGQDSIPSCTRSPS